MKKQDLINVCKVAKNYGKGNLFFTKKGFYVIDGVFRFFYGFKNELKEGSFSVDNLLTFLNVVEEDEIEIVSDGNFYVFKSGKQIYKCGRFDNVEKYDFEINEKIKLPFDFMFKLQDVFLGSDSGLTMQTGVFFKDNCIFSTDRMILVRALFNNFSFKEDFSLSNYQIKILIEISKLFDDNGELFYSILEFDDYLNIVFGNNKFILSFPDKDNSFVNTLIDFVNKYEKENFVNFDDNLRKGFLKILKFNVYDFFVNFTDQEAEFTIDKDFKFNFVIDYKFNQKRKVLFLKDVFLEVMKRTFNQFALTDTVFIGKRDDLIIVSVLGKEYD